MPQKVGEHPWADHSSVFSRCHAPFLGASMEGSSLLWVIGVAILLATESITFRNSLMGVLPDFRQAK
jgi:hypothetical protein